MEPTDIFSEKSISSIARISDQPVKTTLQPIDIQIEKLVSMCLTRENYYENQIQSNLSFLMTHRKGYMRWLQLAQHSSNNKIVINTAKEVKEAHLPYLRYEFIKSVNSFISMPCRDFWLDFRKQCLELKKRPLLFQEIIIDKAVNKVISSFNDFKNCKVLKLKQLAYSNDPNNKKETVFKTIEGTPPAANSKKAEVLQVIENIATKKQYEQANEILAKREMEEFEKVDPLVEYYPNNGNPKEFMINYDSEVDIYHHENDDLCTLTLLFIKIYVPSLPLTATHLCLSGIRKLGQQHCDVFFEDEKKLQQKIHNLLQSLSFVSPEIQSSKSSPTTITSTQKQELQHATLISNALYPEQKPKRKSKTKKGKEEEEIPEPKIINTIPSINPKPSIQTPKIFLDEVDYNNFLVILGISQSKIRLSWNEAVKCLGALGFAITPKGGSKYKFKFEKQIALIDEATLEEETDEIIEKTKKELESNPSSSKRIDEPHGPGRSKTSPLSDDKLHQFRVLLLSCGLTKECVTWKTTSD